MPDIAVSLDKDSTIKMITSFPLVVVSSCDTAPAEEKTGGVPSPSNCSGGDKTL